MAWLQAIPQHTDLKGGNGVSRESQLKKKGVDIDARLPPIYSKAYLIHYLFEFGPTLYSGGKPIPITFEEMESWRKRTGMVLDRWESITLRDLSIAFVREELAAKHPDREAPWKIAELNRETISDGIEKAFMAFQEARDDSRKK